uniref:O-methyltransferase FtmD n=1 Tax=Talaromyces marneffei PM1 TaxID=1077442 RepID=A0A093V358_TALMA
MSESESLLEELSNSITENARIVSQYLASQNLPQPSFRSDGPTTILPKGCPQSIQARESVIAKSLEILQLAIGPSEFLPHFTTGYQYISCLRWLCQFDIFHLVPLNITISYADLATAAKVPEQRLKSIMRMAMTSFLFLEEEAGSTRTYETAFNLAHSTDLTFFDYLSRNQDLMRDFAQHIRSVRSSESVGIKHLLAGYEWQAIPDGGLVVDYYVGGSTGTSAMRS